VILSHYPQELKILGYFIVTLWLTSILLALINPIYSPGELGKLASRYACRLARLGWPRFFRQHHHHTIKSTSPTLHQLPHPAAPLLARLARQGVPALMTSVPWTTRQQDAVAHRGPHPSAQCVNSKFLLKDMYNMVCMGYWVVLPYSSNWLHLALFRNVSVDLVQSWTTPTMGQSSYLRYGASTRHAVWPRVTTASATP
jgi:hypothetical protein